MPSMSNEESNKSVGLVRGKQKGNSNLVVGQQDNIDVISTNTENDENKQSGNNCDVRSLKLIKETLHSQPAMSCKRVNKNCK